MNLWQNKDLNERIERMSEDADIGITREFLGFEGKLSKNQISDKLRRAACSFVREKLQFDLREQMIKDGVDADKFKVYVNITPVSTTDPEVIFVEYEQFLDVPPVRSNFAQKNAFLPRLYVHKTNNPHNAYFHID